MNLLLWLVVFIALFLIAVRYIEKRSIYFPMREITATPELVGLPFEEVSFQTSDNKRLNGWFIANSQGKLTLVFCHGNAGNISHRLEKVLILHNLGMNVFVFDYRGYGKSTGVPTEAGLYRDVKAAYDYLRIERKIAEGDIVLYGESIGGAVAVNLAQELNVRALITEETFSSIKDMAKIAYPFIPHYVFSSRFDVTSKIRNVACPKLIIHSVDDEIVPFNLGEKLFSEAAQPKTFLRIRGTHNTAFLDSKKQFIEGIRSFLTCEI
ncbi:MAG: alpha/beta hydrolase [Candidatus Omnitrophota bacterium]